MERIGERLRNSTPPASVFIIFIVVWEVLVRALNIPRFLLPPPTAILNAFFDTSTVIFESAFYTLRSALIGFAVGCGAGIMVAFATARWVTIREGVMPLAIAVNSVPIIAFAPLMNSWFGSTNPLSKVAIVALITFFPTMINTVRGLTLVEPAKIELLRSYATSQLEVLLKARVPNALPYMFNAFKVCSTLSLIGAIVSEYFGGPRQSLGVYILQEAQLFRFTNAWAAIAVAALQGMGFYLIILLIERRLIPWHVSLER